MRDLVVVDHRHEDEERTAALSRELQFIVLQHLHEQGFKETAHRLEQESGLFFDTKHLGDLVECGAWDDAERYLGGFTEEREDPCSAKIFFAIRRQKYLEALGRRITTKEGQILVNDLKALAPFDEEAAKMLGSLENFRQDALDTSSARNAMFLEIKKLIEANPLFLNKLDFPSFKASRLQTLIGQSLDWQHSIFKKLKQNPELILSSEDSCDFPTNGARSEIEDEKIGACRTPNVKPRTKVVGLLYTSQGTVLLALGSNAVHKMWKWQNSDINPNIKLWQPANEIVMKNDTSNSNPEEATACIALSTHDRVMSASGGKVSCFSMKTFKALSTFISPPAPPAATSIAFHPRDSYIVALGMDDSTIQIYNFNARQTEIKLRGHQKMVTGLAFPQTMDILVSSGADAQICVWRYKDWKKIRSIYIQTPAGWSGPLVGDTRVQFCSYSTYCLLIHESHLAIYNLNLALLSMWFPRDTLPAPISSAVYSCDGLLVYAGFRDGAIGIFDAQTLSVRCRISPAAYIPPSVYGAGHIYPMVVAAHPAIPNQIALGMNDGAVHVLEPK